MIKLYFESFWANLAMIVALALLIGLIISDLTLLPRQEGTVTGSFTPLDQTAQWERMAELFNGGKAIPWRPATNLFNPFFTTFFQPSAPPPPPPPPATKKVSLLYQGAYETAGGERHAFIKQADQLMVVPLRGKVVADYFVALIEVRFVALTNSAGKTNVLEFNQARDLEVPAK